MIQAQDADFTFRPQAQRIQIARQMQIEYKKRLAKKLAEIDEKSEGLKPEDDEYFKRVFDV